MIRPTRRWSVGRYRRVGGTLAGMYRCWLLFWLICEARLLVMLGLDWVRLRLWCELLVARYWLMVVLSRYISLIMSVLNDKTRCAWCCSVWVLGETSHDWRVGKRCQSWMDVGVSQARCWQGHDGSLRGANWFEFESGLKQGYFSSFEIRQQSKLLYQCRRGRQDRWAG